MRRSTDLPDATVFEYWLSVGVIGTSLSDDKLLPNLPARLEFAFTESRHDWWRLGRLLQSGIGAQYAHMPTAGSFGSDFGIMLAWVTICSELAASDETVLAICDDPWLFRQIAGINGVVSGSPPALKFQKLKMFVRGLLARLKISASVLLAALRLRRQRRRIVGTRPFILVYGHPKSSADGMDAYFGDMMVQYDGLQRILHTDCPASQAINMVGDERTTSLHSWGNPLFAFKLMMTRWKPETGGDLKPFKMLIDRAAVMENNGGGPAMNRWQNHCQQNWVNAIKPSIILWPWENHGWERNLVRAARKMNVHTVGYQHTVVGPHQFNYSVHANQDGLASIPDDIVSSGPAYCAELVGAGLPADRIQIGGALRFAKPTSDVFDPKGPIYFALSPIRAVSEALLVSARYVATSGLNVVVKDHPMYPVDFDEMDHMRRTETTLTKQSNISAVVYATGTSGVEALLMRLPAIRLLLNDCISIDVLPEGFQNPTATAETLLSALERIKRPEEIDAGTIFSEPNTELWRSMLIEKIH